MKDNNREQITIFQNNMAQHKTAFNEARQKYFVALAVQSVNETIDETSKNAVLKTHVFTQEETGERILKHNSDYLMSDEDFKRYLLLVHAEREKVGLHIDSWIDGNGENVEAHETSSDKDSRPALEAAEAAFIHFAVEILPPNIRESIEPISTERWNPHYKRFLELSLILEI